MCLCVVINLLFVFFLGAVEDSLNAGLCTLVERRLKTFEWADLIAPPSLSWFVEAQGGSWSIEPELCHLAAAAVGDAKPPFSSFAPVMFYQWGGLFKAQLGHWLISSDGRHLKSALLVRWFSACALNHCCVKLNKLLVGDFSSVLSCCCSRIVDN